MKKVRKSLVIGTRGSPLAKAQAQWVKDQLIRHHPELIITLKTITTTADRFTDKSLSKIGGKGLFLKEIDEELLARSIDLAVHSAKDVPTEIPKGLTLAAYPEREDARDCLVTTNGETWAGLKPGARIGTSSLRRISQLKGRRSDLVTCDDLRGNIGTRLKKLEDGKYDAVVLAVAGLKRLGLEDHIADYLDIVPAVGQGALAIECREDDDEICALLKTLDHEPTRRCVMAERVFVRELKADCTSPVGCLASLDPQGKITLMAVVASPDGRQIIERRGTDARRLAQLVLEAGGKEILQVSRTRD